MDQFAIIFYFSLSQSISLSFQSLKILAADLYVPEIYKQFHIMASCHYSLLLFLEFHTAVLIGVGGELYV